MSDLSLRQIDALDRVQQIPELQLFFFRRLKGLSWFDELSERGFFTPQHNPMPVETKDNLYMIPTWPVLEYLEKTAPELQEPSNRPYSERYLGIMRAVTTDSIQREVTNPRTWWYFAKLLRFVHTDDIVEQDIELVRYWLKGPFERGLVGGELGEQLLPRLLAIDTGHTRGLARLLLEVLTELTWRPDSARLHQGRNAVLPIDDYDASKIFGTNARVIGEKLEEAGLKIFHGRPDEIFSHSDGGRYSAIWRPTIEDHDQNRPQDGAEHILISAYRDALLGYVDRRAAAAMDYITALLENDDDIFQRLAIFAVGQYHNQLATLLPKILVASYFNANCRHETYHLLRVSFSELGDEEKARVLSVIAEVAQAVADTDRSQDVQEKQRSYEALRWLSAVRGQGHGPADDLYAKNLAVTESEPEHPDFSSYMTSYVGERSAYSAQELLSREFEELVGILSTYTAQPGWREPTRRGLALELKAAVLAKPEHFRGRLTELVRLEFDYICEVLDAHRELWAERVYDNWAELIDFCSALLGRDNFWQRADRNVLGPTTADRGWVVGSIADLIKAGTTIDEKSFQADLLDRAGEILSAMLGRQEGSSFAEGRDALTVAINSPRGKCIEALINYSLRRCRLADKEFGSHSEVWEEMLGPLFGREMEAIDDGNYEFVTLFGRYVLNLLYLDPDWTMEQLPRVFDRSSRLKWLCAIGGYTYVNRIHRDVYRFLRSEGHLIAALDADEVSRTGKGRLIENVVIAYLRGDEQLDDEAGALYQMLQRRRHEELQHLIWFIWTMESGVRPDFQEKILPIWVKISDEVDIRDETQHKILANLCMWIAFVDEIDGKVAELVMKAAPYADSNHSTYIMVRELRRVVGRSPVAVADAYLRMLTRFAPTHPQEDVEATIEALYRSDEEVRPKANAIRELYVKHGVEFPTHIRAPVAQG